MAAFLGIQITVDGKHLLVEHATDTFIAEELMTQAIYYLHNPNSAKMNPVYMVYMEPKFVLLPVPEVELKEGESRYGLAILSSCIDPDEIGNLKGKRWEFDEGHLKSIYLKDNVQLRELRIGECTAEDLDEELKLFGLVRTH